MTDEEMTPEQREAYERHKEKLAHNRNPDNEMSWEMKQAMEYGERQLAKRLGARALERLPDVSPEDLTDDQIQDFGHRVLEASELPSEKKEEINKEVDERFENPREMEATLEEKAEVAKKRTSYREERQKSERVDSVSRSQLETFLAAVTAQQ